MAERAAASVSKLRVLEVAAGTGLVTRALSKMAKEVVATDYAAAMVERLEARIEAENLTNVTCCQADVYSLPFHRGSFDAVVAANVLHLVPDLAGALEALTKVVIPGGLLILPTYCHDETLLSSAVSRVMALSGFPGQRRFSVDSLAAAVAATRAEVLEVERLSGVLPIGYISARTR